VLDAVARKIFGLAQGGELDGVLAGAICCHGLRSVSEFGCRGSTAAATKRDGVDRASSPISYCRVSW